MPDQHSIRRNYPFGPTAGCTWPPSRTDGGPLMPNERQRLNDFLKVRDTWHSEVSHRVRAGGPLPKRPDFLPESGEWRYPRPQFLHDCDDCVFLGWYLKHDLYFCHHEPTVIARASSDGPNYFSGLVFARRGHPFLTEALDRAKVRRLIQA